MTTHTPGQPGPADPHDHHHHGDGHAHHHGSTGLSLSDPACCSHHEVEIDRYITLYLLGGVLVLTTSICRAFNLADDSVAKLPAMIGAVLLGLPLFAAAL